MSSEVRVRFAPSPTGQFHVGSARTALFNWLYARHHGGKFILRIEDTDRERNTPEALQALLRGMRWLGLDWDEGPEVDGDCGPYFQSQRQELYDDFLKQLKATGRTYEKDGALWFRLEGERYTEFDSHLGREIEKVKAKPQVIEDMVRGRVERAEERDFVLVRSNGEPVFHLVNVIDDLTMGITHVIRGEDHLSNTSKHCELFRALGAEPPVFAHIPLILKSNGKGKMSKRDEGALIEQYMEEYFVPQAVVNYLCLLGWSPKDEREMLSLDELVKRFDFNGVSASNAKFDHEKLVHMNAEYLRALSTEDFSGLVSQASVDLGDSGDQNYRSRVFSLVQPKVNRIKDLPGLVDFFFSDSFERDGKTLDRLQKKGDPVEKARTLLPLFNNIPESDWNSGALEEVCERAATAAGGKKFDYFPMLRFAVSGKGGGPDLLPMLEALGKERVLQRLEMFMESTSS